MRGRTSLFVAVSAALSVLLGVSSPAAAATIVITNCTEAGLDNALAAVGSAGTTIVFGCSGTIVITATKTISRPVTLDGNGQQVILSGGGPTGTHQTLFLVGSNMTFTLANVTVSDANVGMGSAAAIFVDGILNVRNVMFANNVSNDPVLGGGAIHNSGGNNVAVSGSTFIGNSSVAGGGAVAVDFGGITIDNSWFENNSTSGSGGALLAGAAVTDVGFISVTTSNFLNNQATGGGGAMSIGDVFNLSIDHTTVSGNSAASGGGIALGNFSPAFISSDTISTSTLSGNKARIDGGGLSFGGINGVLVIRDSTLANNAAAQHGGAVAGGGPPDTLEFSNTTIAGNTATLGGGGIYDPGPAAVSPVTFFSTILSNPQNCVNAQTSAGYNFDADGSCHLTALTDLAGVDPKLGPLQNNGGFTQTMALAPSSPAVDSGPPVTSDPVFTCLPTDQRGISRPQGRACDIGAFELQQAAPTPTPTPTATPSPTPTSTPTQTTMCNPRPNVLLSVVSTGDGRLSVTVTAQTGPGTPQNALLSIIFGTATNALIDAGSAVGSSGGFTLPLPSGTQATNFIVRRAAAGAVTVPFSVNDRCGAWPTFVGGGASAF